MARWSPDRKSIVYTRMAFPDDYSNPLGDNGLFLMKPDGSGQHQLLAPEGNIGNWNALANWSPDGDTIAFESTRRDGGGLPKATEAPSYDQYVFLVNADGAKLRRIATGAGNERAPEFSSDGKRVVFLREGAEGGAAPGTGGDTGLYSVRLDGTNERRLTVGFTPRASFSPDGQWLALVDSGRLWTMRADGGERHVWTDESVVHAGNPDAGLTWSPEGPTVFFPAFQGFVLNHDGRFGRPLPQTILIHKLDLGADRPNIVPVTSPAAQVTGGLDVDWAGGERVELAKDRTPPTAQLVDADKLPLGARGATVAATATSSRIPTISRDLLHFFAIDRSGIKRVQAAIAKQGTRRRCRFLATHSRTVLRPCAEPIWLGIRSDRSWRKQVRRLAGGTYLVGFRTADFKGNSTRRVKLRRVRILPEASTTRARR